MINIDGYLTQQKLLEVFKNIFNEIDTEVKVPNTRYRWDILIKDINTIVEFDGYGHYCKSSTIMNDIRKDKIANNLKYKIVRIPYFVQLTTQTFQYYFNKCVNINQSYHNMTRLTSY